MKALAAERAEVVQEGCKPESGIAQRKWRRSFRGKQKRSVAFADQEIQNRLTMELSQRSVIWEKEMNEGN